jgi:hypothetical protein
MPRITESRYRVDAGWDHAPHLTEDQKRRMLASTPPYLRDARSQGIPSLGEGAIYDIPLDFILCEPFRIPPDWRRGYGLDVGWNWTAAVWMAENPNTLERFIYSEHKVPNADPLRHSTAIKTRGKTLKGAIDPASNASSQKDGEKLFQIYSNSTNGLHLVNANNEVDAGISLCWQSLTEGRTKVFRTCMQWQAEYRRYHRKRKENKDGVITVKIIKKDDHLMDSWRYCENTWDDIASVPAPERRTGRSMARPISGAGL